MLSVKLIEKFNCYLLIVLSVFYHSQKVIFGEGSNFGPTMFLLMMAISLWYFFVVLIKKWLNRRIVIIWLGFFIINTINFFLTADYEQDLAIFKGLILNFLPFFAFYYFAKKGILTKKMLIFFFIMALPLLSYQFIVSIRTTQIVKMRDDVVDNSIYILIGLLPFAFFFNKKFLTLSSLLIIWFFMVESNKRAAILCGSIAILIFIYQVIFISKYKYKIQAFIFPIIFLSVMSYATYNIYSQNEFLSQRIDLMIDGDASGRDWIIGNHFDAWYTSNDIMTLIFGFGYNSSFQITGNVAHNDWIDMLGSFGILGVTLYLFLWYYLIRELFTGNWNKNNKIMMILYLAISFIASMFFRWYNSPFPFMNYIILPYLILNKEEVIHNVIEIGNRVIKK